MPSFITMERFCTHIPTCNINEDNLQYWSPSFRLIFIHAQLLLEVGLMQIQKLMFRLTKHLLNSVCTNQTVSGSWSGSRETEWSKYMLARVTNIQLPSLQLISGGRECTTSSIS